MYLHFNIRIIRAGDAYGRDDCLLHNEKEPMIEFYDPRYPHTNLGQFVSRYYLKTLLDSRMQICNNGLCLDAGIKDWRVSPAQMIEIFNTVDRARNIRIGEVAR